ncbi:MAG: hypothetical protein IRZ31_01560 [Thermogemmatispora sp.]|uniref:hypothetical protein n=1 Tax=Thermogemmatispora sp. TaxID=1968838 RepID=UPI0026304864|nr:hypothetical protein [Thermogemmatispora sp.]MBX5455560.1 hypothetical protein [Thermogemmatispora sp.]
MRAIRDCADLPLHWREGTLRCYRLQAGEETLALISFQRLAGTAALAEVAEGRFCFERRGLWLPQVAIRQDDERGEELAIFEPQLWSRDGVLIGLHGPLYRWSRVHEQRAGEGAVPGPCWEWQDLTERPLLHFSQLICLPHMRMSGVLTIEQAAAGLSLLPLLATLGWYLLVLYEHGATRPLPEVHSPLPRQG